LRHKYGKRVAQAYIIGLPINKNLKLKKRKGKDKQQREGLYIIPSHVRVT
jgi:hypothetical protein